MILAKRNSTVTRYPNKRSEEALRIQKLLVESEARNMFSEIERNSSKAGADHKTHIVVE